MTAWVSTEIPHSGVKPRYDRTAQRQVHQLSKQAESDSKEVVKNIEQGMGAPSHITSRRNCSATTCQMSLELPLVLPTKFVFWLFPASPCVCASTGKNYLSGLSLRQSVYCKYRYNPLRTTSIRCYIIISTCLALYFLINKQFLVRSGKNRKMSQLILMCSLSQCKYREYHISVPQKQNVRANTGETYVSRRDVFAHLATAQDLLRISTDKCRNTNSQKCRTEYREIYEFSLFNCLLSNQDKKD